MRGGVVERQARLFLSQAVKIFDSVEDDVDLQEIEQEIMVMKDLKHKNCLQLCAPHQRPPAPTSSSLAPAPAGHAVALLLVCIDSMPALLRLRETLARTMRK